MGQRFGHTVYTNTDREKYKQTSMRIKRTDRQTYAHTARYLFLFWYAFQSLLRFHTCSTSWSSLSFFPSHQLHKRCVWSLLFMRPQSPDDLPSSRSSCIVTLFYSFLTSTFIITNPDFAVANPWYNSYLQAFKSFRRCYKHACKRTSYPEPLSAPYHPQINTTRLWLWLEGFTPH